MNLKFDKLLTKVRESDAGTATNGIPSGGTAGQMLKKNSNTDYDAGWSNGGAGDMVKATYDPNSKNADAFNMDNMVAGTTNKLYTATIDTRLASTSGNNTGDQTLSGLGGVAANGAITGATKTKITYDAKGLVTSGSDATTADIASSTNKNYVTDVQLIVIGNTSGANSGDNASNSSSEPSGSVATHAALTTGVHGAGANNFIYSNDSRLTDARTPTAHNQAESTITFTNITTGNVSTTAHGFFPQLPTATGKYLKDDLTWGAPTGGSGDMTKAVYDPTTKNADAFSMDNMVEGTTTKILTAAERTILSNTSGINTGDKPSGGTVNHFQYNNGSGGFSGSTFLTNDEVSTPKNLVNTGTYKILSDGNNGFLFDNSGLAGGKNNFNLKCGSDGTFIFDQGGGLNGRLKLGGTSAIYYWDITPDFGNSYFIVKGDKSVGTTNNVLDDGAGKMGVNISPTYALDVLAAADKRLAIRPNALSITGILINSTNAADSVSQGLEFGGSQFYFQNKVGIKKAAANGDLDVVGTISTDAVVQTKMSPTNSVTISAGFCSIVCTKYTVASGKILSIGSGSIFKII